MPRVVIAIPKSLRRRAAEIEGWLDLGCPEKAITKLGPLLETAEARAAGLYLRTRALVGLERYAEALNDIEALRALNPDPDWLDLTEAWCQKRVGNVRASVACMERLLARSPRSALGHFNLGCYLALLGDKARALDEVTRACGLDEKFRKSAATEADLASLRGDPEFERLIA
jgi:tetratricopeptide (TPR) repeat protein